MESRWVLMVSNIRVPLTAFPQKDDYMALQCLLALPQNTFYSPSPTSRSSRAPTHKV